MSINRLRGYTLVELIIAVGLFALVMLLASGSYLMMINLNRQTQSVATGIDSLSFAIETMVRNIRTGTVYNCGGTGDCENGSNSFTFKNASGLTVTYNLSDAAIRQTVVNTTSVLTDPAITVSSLMFYAAGTSPADLGDYNQPRVTIVVSGTVVSGPASTQPFHIETGATMRGTDL